ncbi:hypothetical protein EI94DRAFT_1900694 [Lactarius quietus]|nr:hypothetical protein EI94DRAFT_1900694 [Lactarius quietus]
MTRITSCLEDIVSEKADKTACVTFVTVCLHTCKLSSNIIPPPILSFWANGKGHGDEDESVAAPTSSKRRMQSGHRLNSRAKLPLQRNILDLVAISVPHRAARPDSKRRPWYRVVSGAKVAAVGKHPFKGVRVPNETYLTAVTRYVTLRVVAGLVAGAGIDTNSVRCTWFIEQASLPSATPTPCTVTGFPTPRKKIEVVR